MSIGKHFHVSCQRERLDGSTHVPQLTQQTVFSFTNWLSVFVHNDIVTSYRRVQRAPLSRCLDGALSEYSITLYMYLYYNRYTHIGCVCLVAVLGPSRLDPNPGDCLWWGSTCVFQAAECSGSNVVSAVDTTNAWFRGTFLHIRWIHCGLITDWPTWSSLTDLTNN